jgi:hypothetical protein
MTFPAKLLFVSVLLVHLTPVIFLLLVALVIALPVLLAGR